MLAVAAFVAFWVLVALGLFVIAARGGAGARPSPHGPTRGAIRAVLTLFLVTVVVFGVGIPLLMLTGNHANASAQIGGIKLNASEKTGRELFGEHCGVCHTLAAANAVGKVGPNLDQIQPAVSLVLKTISNGCLQNAPSTSQLSCLGYGTMPSGIVQGTEATDVAEFVARVAGKE